MIEKAKVEEKLSNFVHDLFLDNVYLDWRKNIKSNEESCWHSLIVCLNRNAAPLDQIKSFGEDIFSKLVFSYIKASDYSESKMLMVTFTVSESIWHSLIWHCPERN